MPHELKAWKNVAIPAPLRHKTQEECIHMAIQAMHDSGYHKNGHTNLTNRHAVELFGVPRSTLKDWFKGKTRPAHFSHESQQKLTHSQEEVLSKWARHMSRRGIPLTQASICNYAAAISGKDIGLHWVDRYLARQKDTLKIKWTQALEKCRAQVLNPTAVKEFFDELL
ncbi:hypothetical protein FA15DRAFT_711326 [Coprinopsis marcescibilis]|uniref:HTH CENPB-type domain-containing protein n=1 Tax=Coprinopsis marcescibilis TaxID=230819 RepID=A0A5C3K9Z1_COPMA|nr:hypothetical protein FA15DRAFT_711326 [Coprinopsis marcescibilis]